MGILEVFNRFKSKSDLTITDRKTKKVYQVNTDLPGEVAFYIAEKYEDVIALFPGISEQLKNVESEKAKEIIKKSLQVKSKTTEGMHLIYGVLSCALSVDYDFMTIEYLRSNVSFKDAFYIFMAMASDIFEIFNELGGGSFLAQAVGKSQES